MSYQLSAKGVAAVKVWLDTNGIDWNLAATCDEIDEALANRSEGESLEVEMRGPRGLVFFTPAADEVDYQPAED